MKKKSILCRRNSVGKEENCSAWLGTICLGMVESRDKKEMEEQEGKNCGQRLVGREAKRT